jgi:hypothetical protein
MDVIENNVQFSYCGGSAVVDDAAEWWSKRHAINKFQLKFMNTCGRNFE